MRIWSLSRSGTIAAIAIGAACASAGFTWLVVLLAFFLTSTAFSRYRSRTKADITGDIIEKSGRRDAWQVIANGGVFAACALASAWHTAPLWYLAGAGAIAASTSDTWATEVGTLSKSAPRSIVSFRKVEPGTSGGVTAIGMLASAAGAAFIALTVWVAGWPLQSACAALAGGIGGSVTDSLLGATIQQRRWCPTCGRGTERAVHTCGTMTDHSGGIRWLRNDLVNFTSSLTGALLGALCL